ncbi:flavin reductase family protein [Actinoplanes sp. NPDC049681]|uniref:flavin reductase family protein n=1 Tax=Actinoplanes sp. NPDC049681 TaxID=3363905 RepID=UPI0037989B43
MDVDLDYEAFRAVMGSFASGVAVVTTRTPAGEPYGLTCSSVCSVSADPPLLLACIRTPSRTLDVLRESGVFAVNFLDAHGREISRRFAGPVQDKFDGVPWRPGTARGVPVLDRVLAHAECSIQQLIDAGDHVVVIGLLVGGDVDRSRSPLGYWRGSYMQVYRMDQPGSIRVEVPEIVEPHGVGDAEMVVELGFGLERIGL